MSNGLTMCPETHIPELPCASCGLDQRTVEVRRNNMSSEWRQRPGMHPGEVESANREAGWVKYRIKPAASVDAAWQVRRLAALASRQEDHQGQIRDDAERLREEVGYIVERVAAGRYTVGSFADNIVAAASRLGHHVAALEALNDAHRIIASGPVSPGLDPKENDR